MSQLFGLALRCLSGLGCVSACLIAQRDPVDEAPGALQRAWLSEVLDLDTEQAVKQYGKLARDARSLHADRWLAAGRLAELARLGVNTASAPGLAEAPTSVRNLLATPLPSLDPAALALRLAMERTVTLHELTALPGKLPELRPLVPQVADWRQAASGPSLRDRQRQRMQSFANLGRSPQIAAQLQRYYALTIVRAEIDGRRSQADALRALYFANWQPVAIDGSDAELLARAITRLQAWVNETGQFGPQNGVLKLLLAHLQAHQQDPDLAPVRELLLRLPQLSERILAKD